MILYFLKKFHARRYMPLSFVFEVSCFKIPLLLCILNFYQIELQQKAKERFLIRPNRKNLRCGLLFLAFPTQFNSGGCFNDFKLRKNISLSICLLLADSFLHCICKTILRLWIESVYRSLHSWIFDCLASGLLKMSGSSSGRIPTLSESPK